MGDSAQKKQKEQLDLEQQFYNNSLVLGRQSNRLYNVNKPDNNRSHKA